MIDLSFHYFGANTVILQTVPIFKQMGSIHDAVVLNEKIWKYAEAFNRNATKPAGKKVIVMDVFSYSVFMFLHNSMAIGLYPIDQGMELKSQLEQAADFGTFLNKTTALDDTLRTVVKGKGKIGLVCGDKNCETKSRITYDGMHWCMKETSGRLNAGLACLLKCSIQDGEETLTQCERRCNSQYMSLKAVPWKNAKQLAVEMPGFEYY